MFLMSQSKCTTSVTVILGDVQGANETTIVRWARQTVGMREADYFDAHVRIADDFSADTITQTASVKFWRD